MIKLTKIMNEGKLSKSSLDNIRKEVINDIHEGYYDLADAVNGKLRYAYMDASQNNSDWKNEYETFKKIKKLVDSLETGKIL